VIFGGLGYQGYATSADGLHEVWHKHDKHCESSSYIGRLGGRPEAGDREDTGKQVSALA
jgi:hypothetical protein